MFNVTLLKLSWKKWISNKFSLWTIPTILLQYTLRLVIRHWGPIYLTNSDTLNFFGMTTLGIKHISVTFMDSYKLVPSITLVLYSRVASLSEPFSSTTFSFWISSAVRLIVGGAFVRGIGKYVVNWAFSKVPIVLKLCGMNLKGVVYMGADWVILTGYIKGPSPNDLGY